MSGHDNGQRQNRSVATGTCETADRCPGLDPWSGRGGIDGSAVALVDAGNPNGRPWTYGVLDDLVRRRAAELAGQGLRPGQLVAVPERSATELALMQHALARASAALLPLRAQTDDPAVGALIAQTGAEWIWTGDGVLQPAVAAAPAEATWDSPLSLVVETSGSSGRPRAAMLTARNLRTSAALSNRRLDFGPGDAWLCCLPLRHIGGLSIVYRCALAGARLILRQGFAAGPVAEDLARHAVTHVSLVPPMLARLLELDRAPPPALRVALIGGQGLSEPLARRAIERGWPIHVTYGMTETASQVAVSERLAAPAAGGRIGLPLPGMALDCPDCDAPPAPLRLRGPLTMAGYANPARLPGQGLTDGWLVASDLACRDREGRLHILGRADEVLVTGGVNVHPARVESVLAEAPGVDDLAVIGVADPVWGQRLVAVYRGECAPDGLDAWCRARLAGPERPRSFVRVAEFPLLESGKRDRQRLRRLAESGGDA